MNPVAADSDLVTLWIPGDPPSPGEKLPPPPPDVARAHHFAAGRMAGRHARRLPLGTPERRAFAAEITEQIATMSAQDLGDYLAGMSAGMGRPTR